MGHRLEKGRAEWDFPAVHTSDRPGVVENTSLGAH